MCCTKMYFHQKSADLSIKADVRPNLKCDCTVASAFSTVYILRLYIPLKMHITYIHTYVSLIGLLYDVMNGKVD